MSIDGFPLSYDPNDPRLLWWEDTAPESAAREMVSVVDALYERQYSRRERNLRHAKLWANQDLASLYDTGVVGDTSGGVYLSVNVTESCVNTLTAKMTRTRVRPSLQTYAGSRSLQRAAEGGTDFIDGVYHANALHEEEGEQCFTDGALFGNGWVYAEGVDGEITVDRVLPDEMLFNETEAMYGLRSLFSLYRRKYVHRQALYRLRDENGKLYADDRVKRAAIKSAEAWQRPGSESGASEMIPLYFGWHLPTKMGAGDGRMLVAIRGCNLFGKKWERTRFPFACFNFQRRPMGLWGRSLAEQLVPIQLKINEQLEVIDEGERLNSMVRLIYEQGALIPDDFDNEVARLIELQAGHNVNAVKEVLGNGASPQTYKSLEDWIRRAYEVTGISMLSATAEKPEGITSAVALRELLDREDLRFSALGKRWERFHRDIGELILDTAAEMDDVNVVAPGDRYAKPVDWKKLALDRSKMMVTVGAASSLPTTPAARKQYADELLDRQAITMARYLEIIDESGDVRGVTSLVTAVQESIDLDIEGILDDGKWSSPDKLRDPALARDSALAAYAKAVHEDVPAKNLELLRRYIVLATQFASAAPAALGAAGQAAQQSAQAAAPPPAAAGPAGAPPLGETLSPDLQAAAPPPAPPVQPVQPIQ